MSTYRGRIVARPAARRRGGEEGGIASLKGPQRHKSLIVPSVARDRHLDASRIPFICISVLLGLPLRRVYLFIRLAIYRLNVASFRPGPPPSSSPSVAPGRAHVLLFRGREVLPSKSVAFDAYNHAEEGGCNVFPFFFFLPFNDFSKRTRV